MKQMKKEKGMVTRTRSQQRIVRIQPHTPMPVSLSSAALEKRKRDETLKTTTTGTKFTLVVIIVGQLRVRGNFGRLQHFPQKTLSSCKRQSKGHKGLVGLWTTSC